MRTPPIGRRSDDIGRNTLSKEELTSNWLPRYTGMPLENFGDYILLTNFSDYVNEFARQFDCQIYGEGRPMQAATNYYGFADCGHAKGGVISGQVWWSKSVD